MVYSNWAEGCMILKQSINNVNVTLNNLAAQNTKLYTINVEVLRKNKAVKILNEFPVSFVVPDSAESYLTYLQSTYFEIDLNGFAEEDVGRIRLARIYDTSSNEYNPEYEISNYCIDFNYVIKYISQNNYKICCSYGLNSSGSTGEVITYLDLYIVYT